MNFNDKLRKSLKINEKSMNLNEKVHMRPKMLHLQGRWIQDASPRRFSQVFALKPLVFVYDRALDVKNIIGLRPQEAQTLIGVHEFRAKIGEKNSQQQKGTRGV